MPARLFEEEIRFSSGQFLLEGKVLYAPDQEMRGGCLLCPPHPALGGNMGNNVIVAVAEELARRGGLALAFNYRGVGESGGGVGSAGERYEQWESRKDWCLDLPEIGDLIAAWGELGRRAAGTPMTIVGYSFGAFLALKAARGGLIAPSLIVGIAPPVKDVKGLLSPASTLNVRMIYGDRDFASPLDMIRALPSGIPVEIMTDCDHFFIGSEWRVARSAAEAVEEVGR